MYDDRKFNSAQRVLESINAPNPMKDIHKEIAEINQINQRTREEIIKSNEELKNLVLLKEKEIEDAKKDSRKAMIIAIISLSFTVLSFVIPFIRG